MDLKACVTLTQHICCVEPIAPLFLRLSQLIPQVLRVPRPAATAPIRSLSPPTRRRPFAELERPVSRPLLRFATDGRHAPLPAEAHCTDWRHLVSQCSRNVPMRS